MYISTRTAAEIAGAVLAVAVIADAYNSNLKIRKAGLKGIEKMSRLTNHLADKLDRSNVPFDRFDEIVMQDILHS